MGKSQYFIKMQQMYSAPIVIKLTFSEVQGNKLLLTVLCGVLEGQHEKGLGIVFSFLSEKRNSFF